MSYGYPGHYQQPMGPKPDNHLVWAILSTVFCCQITGIVAIVYAAQVDGKYQSGDYAGAVDAAGKARTWSIAGAAIGGVIIAIYLIFVVALAVGSTTSTS